MNRLSILIVLLVALQSAQVADSRPFERNNIHIRVWDGKTTKQSIYLKQSMNLIIEAQQGSHLNGFFVLKTSQRVNVTVPGFVTSKNLTSFIFKVSGNQTKLTLYVDQNKEVNLCEVTFISGTINTRILQQTQTTTNNSDSNSNTTVIIILIVIIVILVIIVIVLTVCYCMQKNKLESYRQRYYTSVQKFGNEPRDNFSILKPESKISLQKLSEFMGAQGGAAAGSPSRSPQPRAR